MFLGEGFQEEILMKTPQIWLLDCHSTSWAEHGDRHHCVTVETGHWGNGSVGKSMYLFSCRGPKFAFRNAHQMAHNHW